MPPAQTLGPGTITGPINLTTPGTRLGSGGPSGTTITSAAITNGETLNFGTDNVQVGDLAGDGFTINDTAAGGVAVQMLGSFGTLEGNILSSAGGQGADVVTGGGANNLLIDGNTFGGTGFALAYVNGALDTYTASTNVDIENNIFTGTATAGADIADDAASGTISGNSFSGSGTQAIFLGGISAAAASFFNNQFNTTYVAVPGTVVVGVNNFANWSGADVTDFDASYTFGNGGAGAVLSETITASGQEIDTLTGYRSGNAITGDTISLVAGHDTALGVHQAGTGEADVYLSNGDELVIKGTSVNAKQIGTMVGAPQPNSDYILVPTSPSGTFGHVQALGQVGGDVATVVDASAPSYISFSTGAGNDTVIANTGDTITLGNGVDKVTLNGDGNTVIAGTGSETITSSGQNNIFVDDHGVRISISNGHWVVANSPGTDTLTGIDKVVINGQTYDLVDQFGAAGGFQSLQAAIDAASNGDKILVAPGSYTEGANFNETNNTDDPNVTNPIGLLINKSVTIEGVDSHGNLITSATNTQATIVSSAESDWGTNFYVTAPDVRVTGLNLQATDSGAGFVNKAVEAVANNFTLEDSQVTATSGLALASSVYIGEQDVAGVTADISSFDISDNVLTGDFLEANGVGYGDATTNLLVADNKFTANAGASAATYANEFGFANAGVVLNGPAPVALPDVTGNTMAANYTESTTGGRFVYFEPTADAAPTIGYIQDYLAANKFGNYAYAVTPGGAPDILSDGGYFYQIFLNTGDATLSYDDNPGDTIVVQSGSDSSVQLVGTNDLTIDALSGSNVLDLALDAGVTDITLADYAPGKGVNITVTGAGSGETIVGNDGNDKLTGGASSNVTGGNGNNTLAVGDGTSGSHNHSSITAGNGNNTVTAGSYTDVSVGNGNDKVTLSGDHDTLTAGNGQDTVTVSGNHNTLTVGSGRDTITVSGNHNTVTGGTGNDGFTLSGNSNSLLLNGTINRITVAGGSENIITDASSDHLSLTVDTTPVGFDILNFSVANGVVSLVRGGSTPTTFADVNGVPGVLSDMSDDGNGGTLLHYGSTSIDFQGVMKSSFAAHDFKFPN
ncbi:MAG TPA: calcium-binding protein [Stellaceae bacterium]|nr:calcium-binding protein [Stellaceae bacterium]